MKTIGITGGVGSGKTEVLTYIEKHYDARIIVADLAAKELEQPGEECYQSLVDALGLSILDENGQIDKKVLADRIFSDQEILKTVNGIIHPAVKNYILQAIEEERGKGRQYVIVEAALLIEEGYQDILDEMWYIYASEEVRSRRLRESRGYSDQKIKNIMAAQKKEEEFRAVCDHVIYNDSTKEEMQKQVTELLGEGRWGMN